MGCSTLWDCGALSLLACLKYHPAFITQHEMTLSDRENVAGEKNAAQHCTSTFKLAQVAARYVSCKSYVLRSARSVERRFRNTNVAYVPGCFTVHSFLGANVLTFVICSMWVEVQRHEGSHKEAFATEKEQCYAAIRKSGLIINAKKQTMVTACNCLLPTPNQNVRCPSKVPMSGWGGSLCRQPTVVVTVITKAVLQLGCDRP